jgi:hypothetical protein
VASQTRSNYNQANNRMKRRLPILPLLISLYHVQTFAQSIGARTLSGALVTGKNEAVAGERTAKSDAEGNFTLTVPREAVTLVVAGKNLVTVEKTIAPDAPSVNLRIEVVSLIFLKSQFRSRNFPYPSL